MACEYQYEMYNPGQYPVDVQKQLDDRVADGWQVSTALPNYGELYVLWQRELPVTKADAQVQLPAAREKAPAKQGLCS